MKQLKPLGVKFDESLIEFVQLAAALLLLILASTLRRSGGGEMVRVGEAVRLTPPSAILRTFVRENVVMGINNSVEGKYKSSCAQYEEDEDDVSGEKETRRIMKSGRELPRSHMVDNPKLAELDEFHFSFALRVEKKRK